MVMADAAGTINKIVGGPVGVAESGPNLAVVVDRDGIGDLEFAHGLAHIVEVFFESELWRVHADDNQTAVLILFRPRADIGQSAQAVDTGVSPEIHQDDFSF